MVIRNLQFIDKVRSINSFGEEVIMHQGYCDAETLKEIKELYSDDVWIGKKTFIVSDTLWSLLYLKYHKNEDT